MRKITINRDLAKQRLEGEEILELIKNNTEEVVALDWKRKYFKGENVAILKEQEDRRKRGDTPNNAVPVPYYRALSRSMIGYMYSKPIEMIDESGQNESYLETLKDVWKNNNSDIKNTEMGKDQTVFGLGYELLYTEVPGQQTTIPDMIRFAKIKVEQCIPIFNQDVEEKLIAMIRYYDKNVSDKNHNISVFVYYTDVIEEWEIIRKDARQAVERKTKIKARGQTKHFFNDVPWVIYPNMEEMLGDVEPTIPLIDAYDKAITGDVNEVDRFAELYLFLKGLRLDDADVDELKEQKIISTPRMEASAEYLKKDINTDFTAHIKEVAKNEIHKQTGIIDLTDPESIGNDPTGVALRYRLHNMELIAAEKERYFKQSLTRRNQLISNVLNISAKITNGKEMGEATIIDFKMERNLPANIREKYDIALLQKNLGTISDQTINEMLPDIDPKVEKQKLSEEVEVIPFPQQEDNQPEEDEETG